MSGNHSIDQAATRQADTPVFWNKEGGRIKPDNFRKDQWHHALSVLNIPPRDFYSTKDTAISLDITAGENTKKVAQEAGITLATLSAITASIWTRQCRKSATELTEKEKA